MNMLSFNYATDDKSIKLYGALNGHISNQDIDAVLELANKLSAIDGMTVSVVQLKHETIFKKDCNEHKD